MPAKEDNFPTITGEMTNGDVSDRERVERLPWGVGDAGVDASKLLLLRNTHRAERGCELNAVVRKRVAQG